MNATDVSRFVSIYEQFCSTDGVWLKRLCEAAATDCQILLHEHVLKIIHKKFFR